MKIKVLLFILFTFAGISFAQYPEVTIKDIQYQDPSGLINYFDDDMPSPLEGDTVIVTGIIMCSPYKSANPDSGVLMYLGGGSAGFYLQDTSETEWSGVLVLHENVSGVPAFQILDSGTVVKLTCIVYEYSTTTQKTTELKVINFDPSNVIDFRPRPQPVEITLDSLKEIGTDINKAIAEKWEGVYVVIKDVVTTDRNSSGGFRIFDSNNTYLNVGTKSNYYYQNPAPLDNTPLEYIRGYIETRSAGSGGVTINPAYPDDINILTFPPSVSTITRDKGVVHFGEEVTVSAEIVDQDGTIQEAKVFYRKNNGNRQSANMSNTGGDTWSGTIPAQNDSSLIDFYVWAKDNTGLISINPADTIKNLYFYLVLDRDLTIQDVQYSPFGGGWSGYNNYDVTIRGIVTADTTDFTDTNNVSISRAYLQNGTGPWSGIQLYGSSANTFNKGDDVSVTGTIEENFNVTRINISSEQMHSTGNPLPAPVDITVSEIGSKPNGTIEAEQWESVLVNFNDVSVIDENADGEPGPGTYNYGEIEITDAGGDSIRVELQDGKHSYHNFWSYSQSGLPVYLRVGDKFGKLTGVMYFSHYYYKLVPRTDSDFIGYIPVAVNEEPELPNKYSLNQNYPNPFNPSTKITYSIPKAGIVSLKVYNILGQEIRSIVSQFQNAGSYEVNFDAGTLSSGVYFYSLKVDDFNQIKKMLLIK